MTRLHNSFAAPALLLIGAILLAQYAAGQSGNAVVTVSAASFESRVAPESIVSAFGSGLAVRTEAAGGSLPTTLAGTTVRVNGQSALLFFVSPAQVNFVIPAGTAVGSATVVVTNGNGVVSNGTVEIARAAPAVFAGNGDGQGVPAGSLLRVRADGSQSFEPLARFDQASGRFVTLPIDPGPAGDRLFLVLFLTGARNAAAGTVNAVIGGQTVVPLFVGPAPGFVGLDQANIEIPRPLGGRGRVSLTVAAQAAASNLVEVEIGSQPGPVPPRIDGHSPAMVLAGSEMTITGAGFSTEAAENLVRVGGVEARVVEAAPTQIRARVPVGVITGPVSVRTPGGEGQSANAVPVRTSVSGFVEDTRRQPLAGVVVRMLASGITATTGAEGSFILPDVPASPAAEMEFDGTTVPGTLPYPKLRLKLRVNAGRDNQFFAPVALQQIAGPSLAVGTAPAFSPQQAGGGRVQTGEVVFEVAGGTAARFPDGATGGNLSLTIVENSRTPINLPAGQFSSTIAQISPFGVTLTPGGKLTFPNTDGFAPGTQARLFRMDQLPGSTGVGSFADVGAALVSADGRRIETAPNAINQTSYYFVSIPRLTTAVTGRVLDGDRQTPVRQALVRARGQETFSDGNGGFILRNVLVNAGDQLTVEAGFQRAVGRVDRTSRVGLAAAVGGLTDAGDLILSAENSNRPPVVLAPPTLAINENESRTINLVIGDPDAGQTVQVTVSGANFASIGEPSGGLYPLRLAPRTGDAGTYTLRINAVDNLGASLTHQLALRVNRPSTALPQIITLDEDTRRAVTLTANDPDSDQLFYFIVRNPARGSLTSTPPNLIYTPTADFNGTDSFTFKVNDGVSDSNEATISLFVNPVNDPPTLIVPGPQKIDTGQLLNFTVSAADIDGDALTFTATGLPGDAMFTPGATSAQFKWTPSATQYGCHNVMFTVRDNGSPPLSVSREVVITVTPRWQQTPGPLGAQVFAFVASGGNLFAAGSGGVYLSTDQGQSWALTSTGLTHIRAVSLVQSGGALFAGSDGTGVFRSRDQGISWESASVGLPSISYVSALVVVGSELFAGTYGGVFRSADQGQSWTAVNDGLANRKVNALALGGTDLFAATDGGVFRLPNLRQPWQAFSTGLPNQPALSLLVLDGTIYVGLDRSGVFRSATQTASWTAFNSTGLTSQTVLSLALNGAELLAGTFGGVFVSAASSATWAVRNQGLSNKTIDALAVLGGNVVLAGTHGGIYRTTDQGRNWAAGNTGLTGAVVNVLTAAGATLFAGTNADGVHRSIDQGRSWQAANGNPAETHLESRTVPSLLTAGGVLYAGTDNGVYSSADSGASWTERNNGLPPARYTNALTVSGASLFAGTNSGIFRSDNQGQSWVEVNNGLTDRDVRALTALDTTIFAGTEDRGVFRSFDQGQSWTPVNNGLGVLRVHALTTSGVTLYAGTGSGVYRSDNQGQSWTRVSNGLPDGAFINTLLVNGPNLFAGIFGGIFMSCDEGASWTLAVTGLTHQNVFSLAAIGARLFAGTIGGGAFINQ